MALTKPPLEMISDAGTAASLNVGTGANEIVQRDGSGNYPAGNGAAITGIDVGWAFDSDQTMNGATAYSWTSIGTSDLTTMRLSVWDAQVASGTPDVLIRIGPSGGYEDSAGHYVGCYTEATGSSISVNAHGSLTGIKVGSLDDTTAKIRGHIDLTRAQDGGDWWEASYQFSRQGASSTNAVWSGSVGFHSNGNLDRIQIRADGGILWSAGYCSLYRNTT